MNDWEASVEQADSSAAVLAPAMADALARRSPAGASDASRHPRRAPKGQAPRAIATHEWVPPELNGGFRTRIGASIVEEFVAGHDASDVLRELVQNEFDASGNRVSVTFGDTALTISGNGNPIDASGWSRLEVILGTGRVVGGEEGVSVAAKQNGIGSKNFGLRSLFLFGDRIYVRSAGRMAVLDLPSLGTQRTADPASRGQRGVSIHVPYRVSAFQTLAPFTVERERETLDRMAGGLFATLVKLALVGRRIGIRELTLRSTRTGRELFWRQTADPERCKMRGVTATRRRGRLTDREANTARPGRTGSYEELEFARVVPIPTEHAGNTYPAYYRALGRSLKICVSLPVVRKRVDTSQPGNFYYPLRAAHGATGSALSVSAPFKLDADRTELLSNGWNEWLSSEAANFVADLLTSDWTPRFGVGAYLALLPTGAATPDNFAKGIQSHLQERACWPTQNAGGQNAWAKASAIAVPASAELNGFLAPGQYLSHRLSENKPVAAFAQRCGAKTFTLNSLVRLRSGPKDAPLATSITETEANYHFANYRTSLSEEGCQGAMAAALTGLSRHLSNDNRKDLRLTASTLAGDGSLARPVDLIRVEAGIWDVCPAPIGTRLHRSLLGFRAIAGLCKPFEIDAWIQEAAGRAADETIEPDEREALYEHLLSKELKLSPKALAAVRRSPVMKDHRDNWIAPEEMALLPAAQAKVLEPILHAPSADFGRRPALLKRLRIRRVLTGSDLVKLAATVAEHPQRARLLEDLLKKNGRLLMPKTVVGLHNLAFVRSQTGAIARPGDLHLDNPGNRACLENGEAIVAGDNVALYRRLGCREHPSSDTLLARLSALRERRVAPARPDIIYPVLVGALQAEKAPITDLAGDAVLWIDGAYRTPYDSLAGSGIPRWFQGVAPLCRGPGQLRRAFEQLGASPTPQEHHWIAFFLRLGKRYPKGQAVNLAERKGVHEAYQRRAATGLPAKLAEDASCLMGRDGLLYSMAQLRSDAFLEDDYPALAEAMGRTGSKVGFAHITDGSRSFYVTLGLRRLSEICNVPHLSAGSPTTCPLWFRPQHQADMLNLIRRGDFAVALCELAWTHQRGRQSSLKALPLRDLQRRLASIHRLDFVSQITRDYRIAGQTISVPTEAAVFEDHIALLPARSKLDLDQVLSHALAELAGAVRITDTRPLANSILSLLRCRTREDFLAYLRRQGIQPRWLNEVDEEVGEPPPEELADPNEEAIVRLVLSGLGSTAVGAPGGHPDVSYSPAATPTPASSPTPPARLQIALSPLDDIHVEVKNRSGDGRKPPPVSENGGRSRNSSWSPPSAFDLERDRMVGERGEALVYRLELERVRAMGHKRPEDVVVWTSQTYNGSDHDIRSIAEDGQPLWIEVKSTMGSDGRFEWTRQEFEKALRERDHYELWRVYEVHTASTTAKKFRDPIALLARSELILELSSFQAFVEPKK